MTMIQIDADAEDDLSLIDEAALLLAVESMRGMGRLQRAQIDGMLARQPFFASARFASYYMQTENLSLMPWETPPVWIDDIEAALAADDEDADTKKIREAALLLQRMLALGISRYHPDPLHAIAEAEARQPAEARIIKRGCPPRD